MAHNVSLRGGNVSQAFRDHLLSDDAVVPLESFSEERNLSIGRRMERYKEHLRELGIDIRFYPVKRFDEFIYSNVYWFDHREAREILDWHYGVESPFTLERLKSLMGRLDDITAKEFIEQTTQFNLGFLINYIFKRGIGPQNCVNKNEILQEASNGLLDSAGLERLVSLFNRPKLLLAIAYPNLFINYGGELRGLPERLNTGAYADMRDAGMLKISKTNTLPYLYLSAKGFDSGNHKYVSRCTFKFEYKDEITGEDLRSDKMLIEMRKRHGIGKRIGQRLREIGKDQTWLASQVKISRQMLSYWVRGRSRPTGAKEKRLLKALGFKYKTLDNLLRHADNSLE